MTLIARWGVLLTLVLALRAGSVQAQEAIALPTRPGVTQPVLFTAVANPAASVLLFPGGFGRVSQSRDNFLVRTVPDFAALGVNVAVIDAPSDQPGGMSDGFRMGAEHATDVAAAIVFVRQRAAVPVWLVGTSRGTISAASLAARLEQSRIAGLVLTSTVWSGAIPQVPLEQISVPTLVVHNHDDGCNESPFGGVEAGLARLRAAPAKALIAVSGGALRSRACGALSPHGYLGIEDEVVGPIVAWIKAH
jgi:pimeloyl-ACP methyl ester carboxylesterase